MTLMPNFLFSKNCIFYSYKGLIEDDIAIAIFNCRNNNYCDKGELFTTDRVLPGRIRMIMTINGNGKYQQFYEILKSLNKIKYSSILERNYNNKIKECFTFLYKNIR